METDNNLLEASIEAALWYLDSFDDNRNAWQAANCRSLVGGSACEAPLELAVEVLRTTGLKPGDPGGEAAQLAGNSNLR